MKKLLLLLLSVFLFFIETQAQSCHVLFIGNSYTYVNNLPDLVSQMYAESGNSFDYTMSAPGGCTFQQHCSVSLPYIQQGGWDYVVLQEQSQLPSFPESQFMQESYPYAQELCSLIRQYSPDAKIVFYMTWGRENGDPQNGQYYPPLNTYEGMDSLLYLRYMKMAQDNQACVSPIGAVWHYIRDHYPDMGLYQSDGSHPSYFGSYVAACSFYTTFTGQNPANISWNGTLDAESADIAKNAVKKVVYDSLSAWCFEPDTVEPDSTPVMVNVSDSIYLYPNPASTILHIHVPCDMFSGPCSLMIMGENGIAYQQVGLVPDMTLDVSRFPAGYYYMVFNLGGFKRAFRSFIISR